MPLKLPNSNAINSIYRDTPILKGGSEIVYAELDNALKIRYEINSEQDYVVLHVPPQMTLTQVFADIRERLKTLSFAHIFDLMSFPTCVMTIIKLVQAGVSVSSLNGPIFAPTETVITNYFRTLLQKKTDSAELITFLNTEFKKVHSNISVVELTSSARDKFPDHTAAPTSLNFWLVFTTKLIMSIMAIVITFFLLYNIFKK